MTKVAAGDLTARVPVTTSDELGELAHDFNLMARGLEEREQCGRHSGRTSTRRSPH